MVAASRKFAYYENKPSTELPQTFFTKYLVDLAERGIDDGPPELTLKMLYGRLYAGLKAGGHSRRLRAATLAETTRSAGTLQGSALHQPHCQKRWRPA